MFTALFAVAFGIPILIAAATFSWKTLVPIDGRQRAGKKLRGIAGHVAMFATGALSLTATATTRIYDCVSSAVLDPLTLAGRGIKNYAMDTFPTKNSLLFAGGITYGMSTTDRLRDDGGGTRSVMKTLMSTFSGATSSTNESDRKTTRTNCHGTSRGDPQVMGASQVK